MEIKDWLTLFLGAAVFAVSYSQLRVAKLNSAMQLFDRRMAVIGRLKSAIGEIVRTGEVSPQTFFDFGSAQVDAEFLFGKDVRDYLDNLRKDIAFIETYRPGVIDNAPNRESLIETKTQKFIKVSEFYDRALPLFGPYVQMAQKKPRFL